MKTLISSNAKILERITKTGCDAISRYEKAITGKDELNYDAEKLLIKGVSATTNAIKTQIETYRVMSNKSR